MAEDSNYQAKGYTIKQFNLYMSDEYKPSETIEEIAPEDGNPIDLRGVCPGFKYIESLTSPSVRMELAIADTMDLISDLTGNEFIQIELESDSAPDQPLTIRQRIFKIGSVTKSERMQAYVIYTVSPEAYNNETNRIFKSFKNKTGVDHVKEVVEKFLKSAGREYSYEASTGNFNFISPSWRPFDVIAYISDKIVSSETKKAGYMFFENKNGFYFNTIDTLTKGELMNEEGNIPQFTYEQANVGDSEFNAYNIETMNYPDQGNHLEKMRTGAYVNTVIGVKAPALTSGNLPTAGSGSDGPSGSIKKPVTQTLLQVFSEAETLNDAFPFPKIKEEYFDEKKPTRTKIRALPGMKNATTALDGSASAGSMDTDTVAASAYSYSRWQLLNSITLDITVPGNVSLTVGMVIECKIPASKNEEDRTVLDPIYSGRYLITGLYHDYNPEGLTTRLHLSKDSVTS